MDVITTAEKIQQKIEDVLDGSALSHADVDSLIEDLSVRPMQASLRFSDGRGTLTIDFSNDMLESFLYRLKLTRQIEAVLLESIARNITPPRHSSVKVKLRNIRKALGDNQIRFLDVFFQRMGPDGQFFVCLDYLLSLLEDTRKGSAKTL